MGALLAVLKAGRFKVKVLANLVCDEDSYWLVDSCLPTVSSRGREVERRDYRPGRRVLAGSKLDRWTGSPITVGPVRGTEQPELPCDIGGRRMVSGRTVTG